MAANLKMFSREQLHSLYRYCFSLTANETQAYDLLQAGLEKFLKADTSSLDNQLTYAKRVIRNQYIDECRKQAKYEHVEFDDTVTYLDMDTDALEKIIMTQYEVQEIWQKLTASEREIMYFWAVEGYTTDELAEFLDISRGTLLSKIHRLRKRLEYHLDESSRKGAQ